MWPIARLGAEEDASPPFPPWPGENGRGWPAAVLARGTPKTLGAAAAAFQFVDNLFRGHAVETVDSLPAAGLWPGSGEMQRISKLFKDGRGKFRVPERSFGFACDLRPPSEFWHSTCNIFVNQ